MEDVTRCWVVVPAAGSGSRMKADRPKQYLPLAGRTVLGCTLSRLAGHPGVAGIVVALAADDLGYAAVIEQWPVPVLTVVGGATRARSVHAALQVLDGVPQATEWVMVHDAARPCVRSDDITRLILEGTVHPVGAVLGVPVRDTMKRADADGNVLATAERDGLWHALTPQLFRRRELAAAYESAFHAGLIPTDEAMAMEASGRSPRMVEGHADNLKITRPEDLQLAEFHLGHQR